MKILTCKCNIKSQLKTANLLLLLILSLSSKTALAYDPDTGHVPLTQVAIKKYNQCFRDSAKSFVINDRLKKRIIQGNIAMDHGSFSFNEHDNNLPYALLTFHYISRVTNWHFYNPNKEDIAKQNKFQLSHKRLWQWATLGLKQATNIHDKALFLGALIHLTEDLSVPAHVAPVYHGPAVISFLDDFEHLVKKPNEPPLSFIEHITKIVKDDIDMIEIDKSQLEAKLPADSELCQFLTIPLTPNQIKQNLANDTLNEINSVIPKCKSVRWSAFWPRKGLTEKAADNKPNSAAYFHHYGPAFMSEATLMSDGTLIRKGTLSQNQNVCKLDKNDPRYHTFLTKRYIAAIKANMALIHWFTLSVETNRMSD